MLHLKSLPKLVEVVGRHIIKLPVAAQQQQQLHRRQYFHEDFTTSVPPSPLIVNKNGTKPTVPTAVADKYQVFRDHDSSIILDVEEERQRMTTDTITSDDDDINVADKIYSGLNLERRLFCCC